MLGRHDGPDAAIEVIRIGTTVATNALLERQGVPTALVTTAGLGDALAIGYQNRPHLFRLKIELPAPLYREVVEADERVTAEGEVLRALDEHRLAADLERLRQAGIASIAIVFLHGYRYAAARTAGGRTRPEHGLRRGDRLARGVAADPLRQSRRHDGRRRLPDAAARALRARAPREPRAAPSGSSAGIHAEQRRAGRARGVPGLQCRAVRPRRRPGRDRAHRRVPRPPEADRLRHGRHVDRRRALRRRAPAAIRDPGRGRTPAGADDEHPHGCRGRRLGARIRGRAPAGRPAVGRLVSGPRLLPQWRAADGHRPAGAARPHPARGLSRPVRRRGRPAARRGDRGPALRRTRGRGVCGHGRYRRRTARFRIPGRRDRVDGARHPARVGAPGPRPGRVRALLLWRRRAAARLPRGRRTRHLADPDSSAGRACCRPGASVSPTGA